MLEGYEQQYRSDFFRLQTAGETCRLRLIGTPLHYESKGKADGKEFTAKRVAWTAVLRSQPTDRGVLFVGAPSVYMAIRELVLNKEWGDPQGYDVQVTRTGTTPVRYNVVPLGKSKLTEIERSLVEDLDIHKVEQTKEDASEDKWS